MSLRDILWNYPETLKKVYSWATPFSHALVFVAISIVFFSLIFSKPFSNYLNMAKRDGYIEGVVGSTERLNPLYLTTNQVDRDVMELVFTKFIDIDSQGTPIPSLASSWKVSADSKTYTFKIRDDFVWSDGVKVTADDVLFTFEFAKELNNKFSIDTFGSAILTVNISKAGDNEIKFVLPEVNATFLETISVYIIPKHILENTTPDSYVFTRFGTFPTGSGPYFVQRNDGSGVMLAKNPSYPKTISLSTIEFKFFSDLSSLELAFRGNKLDGMGTFKGTNYDFFNEYSNRFEKYSFNMPYRKKIVFFNTRIPKFANSSIRKGVASLVNKSEILKDLQIDGKVSDGPLPSNSWAYVSNLETTKYSVKEAQSELLLAGYTKNKNNGFYSSADGKILSLDITYLDNEFNNTLINYLVKEMENEGVLLNPVPKNFEQLTKEVLASRDFELILYDMEVSVDPDQYNIWHSLKIDFPNLNISGYKFNRVDIYLERGRQVLDKKIRLENYINFQKALLGDVPAIFLYEPKYTYILRKDIDGFNSNNVNFPQQRFRNIINWSFK